MSGQERALAALSRNESINWLFGRVLHKFAERKEWHFLLDLLAGKNPHALEQWISWLTEFRTVLRNPEVAAQKADEELSTSDPERIGDFMAEVFTVIHLSRDGYTDFEAVLAGGSKTAVDFTALRSGRRVRIEVKHLREPQDIIRTAVGKRWKTCRTENPAKFNFGLVVKHQHYGTLSQEAISRLKTAVDQLPDVSRDEYCVILPGEIEVVLERNKRPGSEGTLAIQSGLGSEDFEFDVPTLRGLFLKAFRVTADCLIKFFGYQGDPEAIDLIAMHWETPNMMYDAETPATVKRAIEQAFAAVGLKLTIFIFASPPEHKRRMNVSS